MSWDYLPVSSGDFVKAEQFNEIVDAFQERWALLGISVPVGDVTIGNNINASNIQAAQSAIEGQCSSFFDPNRNQAYTFANLCADASIGNGTTWTRVPGTTYGNLVVGDLIYKEHINELRLAMNYLVWFTHGIKTFSGKTKTVTRNSGATIADTYYQTYVGATGAVDAALAGTPFAGSTSGLIWTKSGTGTVRHYYGYALATSMLSSGDPPMAVQISSAPFGGSAGEVQIETELIGGDSWIIASGAQKIAWGLDFDLDYYYSGGTRGIYSTSAASHGPGALILKGNSGFSTLHYPSPGYFMDTFDASCTTKQMYLVFNSLPDVAVTALKMKLTLHKNSGSDEESNINFDSTSISGSSIGTSATNFYYDISAGLWVQNGTSNQITFDIVLGAWPSQPSMPSPEAEGDVSVSSSSRLYTFDNAVLYYKPVLSKVA